MSQLLKFASASSQQPPKADTQNPWHVLVVDDDESIHEVSRLILSDFQFEQRPVVLTHAYSAAQAKTLLCQANEFAVLLLDVVMESEHSGLDLVTYIRNELNNHFVRIVLRTGQPGQAPEVSVMADYDINDYRNKSDLTAEKMQACLTAALRSYKDIKTIHQLALSRELLSQKIKKRNQELSRMNQQLESEITQRCEVQKELSYTNEKLSSIINNSGALISLKTPDGRYDMVNEGFTRHLQLNCDDVVGRTDQELFSQDIALAIAYSDSEVLRQRSSMQFEEVLPTKQGEHFHLCVKFPLLDDNREVYRICSISTDITERLEAQNELIRLAQYDVLTNLPNRSLFIDRLEQVISRAHWQDKHVAVLFIDLDRFKQINDTLGHPVGDKLLIEVAKRLKKCTRQGDTVSRMGGDEFAVLLTHLSHEVDIVRVTEKIMAAVSDRYLIDGRELIITPSIGISRCPNDGNDAQTLMKKSDVAMYKAKKAGRNNFRFYLKEDDLKANEQLNLELDIRNMVLHMDEQLFLQYQPKVNLHSGKIAGFEALLRWQHPRRGLVGPVVFVPILEETGLIVEVSEWILQQACQFATQLNGCGGEMRVAVNLSSRQFRQDNLIEMVTETLEKTACQPNWLELELTEGALVDDFEHTCDLLNQLNQMGISLALDDFGTGYSSLNYLKRLPFTTLKIDKSFIDNAPTIAQEKAIVTTITQLAQNLDMTVVAEGVETLSQLELMQQLCNQHSAIHIQGYLFSRPLGQDSALLASRNNAGQLAPTITSG